MSSFKENTALRVQNVSKKYGEHEALRNVSFSVKKGEIFGLLGANGAGKTTLINILTGIITPNTGNISYFGQPLNEDIRNQINVSTAYRSLSGSLTIEQNLRVYANIYNVDNPQERIDYLLKELLIEDIRHSWAREISSGQRTRANLAKALINNPQILFLDEATAGLDPQIASKVRKLIKELKITIIFTSHIMSEVEELCDKIAFLREGKILSIDTAEQYKKTLKKKQATLEDVFIAIAENKL